MSFARIFSRGVATSTSPTAKSSAPNTHFRITLRRSAIGLPKYSKRTLEALGIHRRGATVFHRHTPEAAGKILRVKELVEVENVPSSAVRTKTEMRAERKATRGYTVVGSWNKSISETQS
ncbi:ribosomal protein L30p/L7e [Ceratobasidium sp. AG-Ba]|nr:ribosomal protein L30p/L7e [Ceratobasidium sp. AG-Ba]QRW04533.1 ribosomal protein L30p/L7e [Ceratobasidium sp. AG-Ba]